VRLALDADLALLHRLEQGGLRLRRRAVDLVGQQDVGEHGAGPEPEATGGGARRRGVEDDLAGHVGRHEVGGELDPLDVEVERGRQRLHHQRLGDARHALEQHVPAAEQRGHQARQRAVLADHDLGHLVAHRQDGGPRIARHRGVPRRRRRWGRRRRSSGVGAGREAGLGVRHG
jgi:hypothetical protein